MDIMDLELEDKKLKVSGDSIKVFNDFFNDGAKLDHRFIFVPKGIKYISDWKDFKYPGGHVVMDKTICGCGFTEYCLTSPIPTIVASPRKLLLENKFDQHLKAGDPVYYFKNESERGLLYDQRDVKMAIKESMKKITGGVTVSNTDFILGLKRDLINYLSRPSFNKSGCHKIIVTYDSLHYVLEVLKEVGRLNEFNLVIDEFQSLFTDASFKADVEFDVVNTINSFNLKNVMYLSATPLMERYISVVPEFNQLPFYKMIWPEDMVEKINIKRVSTQSIIATVSKLINEYRNGVFPEMNVPIDKFNCTKVISKEIVFYVNSVSAICSIIKKVKLHPDEVNIICAKDAINAAKLEELTKEAIKEGWLDKKKDPKFICGKIPPKGATNKMFTFCTRTAYLGADFYSTCAKTVVCTSINIKTLNLDVALDLPQIAGRQRDETNPFKNEIIYVSQKPVNKDYVVNIENFITNEKRRLRKTALMLKSYNENFSNGILEDSDAIASIVCDAKVGDGLSTYLSVKWSSKKQVDGLLTAESVKINNFLRVSVMRSYEISQPEYQEQVLVKRQYDIPDNMVVESINEVNINGKQEEETATFLLCYSAYKTFEEKLKFLCEALRNNKISLDEVKTRIDPIHYNVIILYGIDKCRAVGYKRCNVENLLNNFMNKTPLSEEIYKTFEPGKRYTVKYIKETLGNIYIKVGVKMSAKATVLKDYFEVKEVLVTVDGKQQKGLLLLGRK